MCTSPPPLCGGGLALCREHRPRGPSLAGIPARLCVRLPTTTAGCSRQSAITPTSERLCESGRHDPHPVAAPPKVTQGFILINHCDRIFRPEDFRPLSSVTSSRSSAVGGLLNGWCAVSAARRPPPEPHPERRLAARIPHPLARPTPSRARRRPWRRRACHRPTAARGTPRRGPPRSAHSRLPSSCAHPRLRGRRLAGTSGREAGREPADGGRRPGRPAWRTAPHAAHLPGSRTGRRVWCDRGPVYDVAARPAPSARLVSV